MGVITQVISHTTIVESYQDPEPRPQPLKPLPLNPNPHLLGLPSNTSYHAIQHTLYHLYSSSPSHSFLVGIVATDWVTSYKT